MRQLIQFSCEYEILAASLDQGERTTGIVIVAGGGQTRIGAHRGFEQLAKAFRESGYSCFRYDRRGVGDSSGTDSGFEASASDLKAAAAKFRELCPELEHIAGFGLCDGATTLSLYAEEAGIDAIILANPWIVRAEANAPPPAAISKHYRERLLSLDGWKRILTGRIDYRKAFGGVTSLLAPRKKDGSLAQRSAEALARFSGPARIILAKDDATAVAFDHEWRKGALKQLSGDDRFSITIIDTDTHSFAREGDFQQLSASCLNAIEQFNIPAWSVSKPRLR